MTQIRTQRPEHPTSRLNSLLLSARLLLAGLVMATVLFGESLALASEGTIAVRGGKLFLAADDRNVLDGGVLVVEEGRITKVGSSRDTMISSTTEVVDASGRWVVPGFVDCHNHTAGDLGDLNDMIYQTNPGLRTLDVVVPDSADMEASRSGGVTCVLLIPGSGTNMSGFGTVVKTSGRTQEEVVIRFPGSLKIAQGDNPKRYWFRVERTMMNYTLRDALTKGSEYANDEDRVHDPRMEMYRGLFARQFPVSVHTQRYQLVMKSIQMLHDEFGLWTVLDHSTMSGFYAAPLAVERDIFTIVGPRQFHFDANERRFFGCAAEWSHRGVQKIGINTDSPVVPQESLKTQAAMACHFGLDSLVALRGLTIVPARALGVGDRCGSLEVGKDADFGIWSGNPLDPRSRLERLYIEGRLVYEGP